MDELRVPRSVIYVCPGPRCDIVPYTFYRHAPADLILDIRHRDVASYRPDIGRSLLAAIADELRPDPAITVAAVIGGSAFSLSYRFEELLAELAAVTTLVGVPVLTDMVAVVGELRARGVERVVVAHRLAGVSDEAIAAFLASAGLTCVAVVAWGEEMATNSATSLAVGAQAARDLTMAAISRLPHERNLLLLGGTWWTEPAAEAATAQGWRLFNNVTAVARAAVFAPFPEKGDQR